MMRTCDLLTQWLLREVPQDVLFAVVVMRRATSAGWLPTRSRLALSNHHDGFERGRTTAQVWGNFFSV
jgi:hypothetical protein